MGIFKRAEQGKTTAILEPANQRLVIYPGHDHLAIEVLDIFLACGVGDRSPVGKDWRHRVTGDLNATIVSLSGEPLPARRGKAGTGFVSGSIRAFSEFSRDDQPFANQKTGRTGSTFESSGPSSWP